MQNLPFFAPRHRIVGSSKSEPEPFEIHLLRDESGGPKIYTLPAGQNFQAKFIDWTIMLLTFVPPVKIYGYAPDLTHPR